MGERLTLPLFAVAGSLLVPALLIQLFGSPAHDSHAIYLVHFFAVILTTATAAAAAVWLTVIGERRGDARAVVIGTAFATMASLLLLHGLATPGVILEEQPGETTALLALAGGATLPVGGAILALAAWPPVLRPQAVPRLIRLEVVVAVAIVALGLLGMLDEKLLPTQPRADGPVAIVALLVGLVLLGVIAWRALRTYILTRRLADLAVVCGICLLAVSLGASMTSEVWSLGWWAGHVLEISGIAIVGFPVARDLVRDSQSRPLTGDLTGTELVREEEAYLGPHIRALMVELAEKDAYTEIHTRRVADLAVQVGENLGVPPHRLRALAMGGLLHDIGKLQIPDSVLRKPGPLDEAEYEIVKHHAEWGYELARNLGLPRRVCRLIRSHHERLDGGGYPDGLGADDLDLDVRILTTCDVYDALISERVYRAAWTPAQALATLRADAGTAFDPRCVDALQGLLDPHREAVRGLAPRTRSPLRPAHGRP